MKRSLAGARKVLKISRSANVRGTIGGSDRDRDQDLNRSTCIRYYASCRGCHYLIFHPQFHPRTRATPKDPPASPRRGRPLAAQPRWPAAARRRRVSRALHGRRTRRTWRPRWRDLDLTRRTTNCQRKTRHALTNPRFVKIWTRPRSGRVPRAYTQGLFSVFRHTRHISTCTMHNQRCGTCPSPGPMSTIASAAQKCAAGCARHR